MIGAGRVLRWRPPRIALAFLCAAAACQLLWPLRILPPEPWLAAIPAAAGMTLMLRAWWLFRQADNPICPTDAARVLLTRDVFALSRNPMYLAMLLLLLAPALLTGSAWFYLAACVQAVILDRYFCVFEERRLRSLFPEAYPAYCRNVRRWL